MMPSDLDHLRGGRLVYVEVLLRVDVVERQAGVN